MRILNSLVLGTLVALSAACASQKEPAEAAVQALETTAAAARPEIERFAPGQLAAIDEAVGGARKKLIGGDYAGALAGAEVASTRVAEASREASEKRAALAQEWSSFAGIPAMVQQATQKIAEITASRRLPKGMDREALDGAQATISRVTGMMAEASKAQASGDLAAAVAKAREIKAALDPLMATLGLPAAGR